MSSQTRSRGSSEVHSLYAFALRAIGDAVLAGAIADTGALAVLPAEAAKRSWTTWRSSSRRMMGHRRRWSCSASSSAAASSGWRRPAPTIGSTPPSAAAASAGCARSSCATQRSRRTVRPCSAARCRSSRFWSSTPAALTPAGALLLVEPLQSLRRLALRDCGLKLLTVEQCAALRASPLLESIDLSANELSAEAALALAQPGGAGLKLGVAESDAADDLAMAAMALTSLEVIGLASTRVTSEGVQLIALGLGSTLLTLDLRSCKLDAASISPALQSLAALKELDLAYCTLSCNDVTAAASVPTLTALDLSACHLQHEDQADPFDFWFALCYHPKLRKLRLTDSGIFKWRAPQWRTSSSRAQMGFRRSMDETMWVRSIRSRLAVARSSTRRVHSGAEAIPFDCYRKCVMPTSGL